MHKVLLWEVHKTNLQRTFLFDQWEKCFYREKLFFQMSSVIREKNYLQILYFQRDFTALLKFLCYQFQIKFKFSTKPIYYSFQVIAQFLLPSEIFYSPKLISNTHNCQTIPIANLLFFYIRAFFLRLFWWLFVHWIFSKNCSGKAAVWARKRGKHRRRKTIKQRLFLHPRVFEFILHLFFFCCEVRLPRKKKMIINKHFVNRQFVSLPILGQKKKRFSHTRFMETN